MTRLLLFLLLALPLTTWAQCTLNTPPCAEAFTATDVATGQAVQTLCVGRAVRFAPGCGRSVPNSLLYYNVLATTPPATTTPPNCDFTAGRLPNNTYTPTTAGAVTVSELANPSGGGQGTVYARNFQVVGTPAPTFTLTPCLGSLVALTVGSSGYDQYFAQVGGGALLGPLAAGSTTTLPGAPAGSSLTVTGRYAGNGLCEGQATQTVPALAAPVAPVLSSLTVAGALPGTLTLAVGSLPAGYLYDVQVADAGSAGGFRPVQAVAAGSSSVTLGGAATGQYRLRRLDACGNQPDYSSLLPTVTLSAASLNNVNTLSWAAAGPVAGYSVLRDGAVLATLPATARSYADAAVVCGTRYTYRVQGTVAGSLTISNDAALQTVSALAPPAPVLAAGFDLQNQVVLTASLPGGAALPAGSELLYTRQGGPGALAFGPVPVTQDTLRDPAPLPALLAAPPCYTVLLQDVCGNQSPTSEPACPVLLTVVAADPAGNTAQLTWTGYQPAGSPPPSYQVLTLAPGGAVLATAAPTPALTYLDAAPPPDRQVLRYRVAVRGGGLPAGQVVYSNVATLTRQPVVVVPNAFTPNGDGLNDVLEIKGRYLGTFEFVVVDRNDQEVFRASDRSQTWDGRIGSHEPVNGAYVWRLSLQDETGQTIVQRGTVSIIR